MAYLRLFGYPTIEVEGDPVNVKSRKGLALLTYLAVEQRPQSRNHLVGMLWPESTQTRARANLRRTLFNLNQSPVQSWLVSDGDMLHLRPDVLEGVDIRQFEELVEDAGLQALERAMRLYVGDFLQGFDLPDSEAFDLWATAQCARWRQMALDGLAAVSEHHLHAGNLAPSIAAARRQIELDPLRESGWRQLMRALFADGRRAEALAAYGACCATLQAELGIDPADETTALSESLRSADSPLGAAEDYVQPDDLPTVAGSASLGPDLDEAQAAPYRGLFAFREEDAPFFFGREEFTELLVNTVIDQSIVAVIGASGSGKTSVVSAGLLPHLRGKVDWRIAQFRLGPHPFRALAMALVSLLYGARPTTEQLVMVHELTEALECGGLTLEDVLRQILEGKPPASRVVLVADQFEELFTLCSDGALRNSFQDLLMEPVIDQQYRATPNFSLVLTIRADFLGHALAHRALADAIQEYDVKLGSMTRPELTRTIIAPAKMQGVAFEAGLVQRILDDVGTEPGNLPLLEFALSMLWERRTNGLITNAAYDEIGRVYGALTHYADQVYSLLDDEDQRIAPRVFTQLIQPGEGTDDTRRVAVRADLGEEAWQLVTRLADARLLITDQSDAGSETAEIVHEALLHHWERLRQWMASDRRFRIWQEQLRMRVRQWQDAGQDEGALLRGVALAEAESWLASRAEDLSIGERQFIEAGVALRQQAAAEAEEIRNRELAAARELAAEAEARRQVEVQAASDLRRRAVWLTAAGVTAALLALVALLFGLQSNRNASLAQHNADVAAARAAEAETARATAVAERAIAQVQTRLARSSRLAVEATSQLDQGNFDLALLLAIEAARMAESVDTWQALRGAVGEPRPLLQTLDGHTRSLNRWGGARWNRDGSRVLTASDDNTAKIWDAEQGTELLTLTGHESSVTHARWNQDESRIMTASQDGSARIWDATSGDELLRLAGPGAGTNWAEWGPEERLIATAHEDGTARVWDAQTGDLLDELTGHSDFLMFSRWSPDGTLLLTGGADGSMRVGAADGTEGPRILAGHEGGVPLASWSKDGRRILSASLDGSARIWDVESGEAISALTGHDDAVWFAIWNDDESRLLTSGADGTARVWDATSGTELLTLAGHEALIYQARWNPDESLIVTAGGDGTARVWHAGVGVQEHIFRHPGAVQGAQWSSTGERILTAGDDGDARIWSVNPPLAQSELPSMGEVEGGHGEANWNPDESLVLIAGDSPDNYLRIWNPETGAPILTLTGHEAVVLGADWSNDGTRILSASRDGSARVWDAASGAQLMVLDGHPESLIDARWNQDESQILTIGADGTARVWDASSGEELLTIADHEDWVWQATWNRDESQILTASVDGRARVFDASTGKNLLVLPHEAWVGTASWSPDERLILTASDDGTAKMWDAETGEAVATLAGHAGEVWGAIWNQDGTQVLTFATDGVIRVWDVATAKQALLLSGHADVISDARWNGDETQILSTSEDGTIRVWNAATGTPLMVIYDGGRFLEQTVWNQDETRLLTVGSGGARQYFTRLSDLIDVACQRVDRNLTTDEWSRFFSPEPYRETCGRK